MFHIILSSLVLSIIHASIPNHWLPITAISKVERWNRRTTLWATAISGFAHVGSTVLIGVVVGYTGYKLAASYRWVSSIAAPAILIALGTYYFGRNFFGHHVHHHFGHTPPPSTPFGKVVLSLSIAMFFSPCIELESYYFTAGLHGWLGIAVVSLVYLLVTVGMMVVYVAIALEGVNRFKLGFIERNEKAITGLVLIIVGITGYFVNL
ncbi:MAG TPA: hypothetical protein VG603_07140 [Chitinophagales bacterium]|nr:hypothetical protein [Chitinophagales bacterium]